VLATFFENCIGQVFLLLNAAQVSESSIRIRCFHLLGRKISQAVSLQWYKIVISDQNLKTSAARTESNEEKDKQQ
jgi:hypothetical protein